MRTKAILFIVVALLVLPNIADAQNWILRARAIGVEPNDSGQEIGETGSEVAVDSAYTLELDITYMLNTHFGIEVIAATAKHDLAAAGGALNGADLGCRRRRPSSGTRLPGDC